MFAHLDHIVSQKKKIEGDDDDGREGESRGELQAARFLASTMTGKHLTVLLFSV